ncbi:hypothetical protein RJT34_03236 [Clitoria ternatea]|uniref:Uncharacterized protein n=1 Tax=Clitoria ternatea TaxID=43366 RepID=A0AAN9KLR9_CLITE
MDRFSRFFLLFCILLTLQFQPATLDEGVTQNDPEKPVPHGILTDTIALLRKSHKSSWEKIKTVIRDLQMQFSPPNLDFRGKEEELGSGGVKQTLKDAVGKSFDQSKETVEGSAESAAKALGEAIQKTAEKVKKETSDSKEEL